MSAGQPSSLDLNALDLNPKALEGLTVVITGTLPNLSRKMSKPLILSTLNSYPIRTQLQLLVILP